MKRMARMETVETQGEKAMLFVIIVIVLLVVLDIAAMRWGTDSREGMNSFEWERRGYHEELFAKHRV